MLSSEIKHFLAYCKLSGFSDKSIETLRLRLNEFAEFLKTTIVQKPIDITYQHLKEFILNYNGKSSVHIKKARIWTLHQFFHFLELNNHITDNIALQFPYPKIEKTIPHFLTIEEFNSLLHYFYRNANDDLGMRDLVMIMFLGLLGLRLNSVISINVDDIDLNSGVLWTKEKGKKSRPLILPKILCLSISKYIELRGSSPGPLFLTKRKKRISENALRKIFRQASVKLGIDKKIHAHLFRHTAATHLTKVSGITITGHVLGHKRRYNTIKYSHLNPDKYAVYMKRHPYMNSCEGGV